MLTLGTRLKNIAFLVIAVLVLGYIGTRYADLGRYVGMRGYYVVTMDLAETGGLFPGSDVTYRGVSVGRVGTLRPTAGGVRAELRINNSAPKIPANLQAVVANLSAVGEEYLDLRPTAGGRPYLTAGSRIPQNATQVPAPVTNLLTNVNELAASVPLDSLRTVVDELGNGFQGQGENLQTLLDTGSDFLQAADAASPQTNKLITDSQTVLRTQRQEADALLAFAQGARLVAGQLDRSDLDLRRLITTTPQAATQLSGLLRDLDPSLSVMLANLLTTSDIAVTRQRGLEELLVRVPQAVAAGSTAITSRGVNFGMATTFFAPLPCTTGYGRTSYRNGLDTSAPPPLNTAAACLMPPSSGVNVRGSANAPKGGGVPAPARPGSLARLSDAALPGALGLPSVPAGPAGMRQLLGLPEGG
jgi:phospholipid/cholesterol/gamma-HCH transport system substrate-binding protein